MAPTALRLTLGTSPGTTCSYSLPTSRLSIATIVSRRSDRLRWQPHEPVTVTAVLIGRRKKPSARSGSRIGVAADSAEEQDERPVRRRSWLQENSVDRSRAQDLSKQLSLENIRSSLIRQEDSIIFSLIERAQFRRNDAVYQSEAIPVPGYDPYTGSRYSLLEYVLRENEQLFGKLRRYTSPDEHAFFPDDLPPTVLPPLRYTSPLARCADSINVNQEIYKMYRQELLPAITEPGDDNNHGSTCMHDVLCLQALSKRIHFGQFVAEAKFRSDQPKYTALIEAQDAEGLMDALTNLAVEERVLKRVEKKAATYGQDIMDTMPESEISEQNVSYKVQPEQVANLYARWIMPLTKDVQVEYLLRRLD